MSNKDAERNSEHTLVLSSEYTSSGTTGSNTDFTVHLKNSSHGHVTAAQLVYTQIPNAFNNVIEGLNSFIVKESFTNTSTTITIPPGRYADIYEIQSAVTTQMRKAFPPPAGQSSSDLDGWVKFGYDTNTAYTEADRRMTLTADTNKLTRVIRKLNTFQTRLLTEPWNYSTPTYTTGYLVARSSATPSSTSYVGLWMRVTEQVALTAAYQLRTQFTDVGAEPLDVITCRIFKMVYNVPGRDPAVLPPSDIDRPPISTSATFTPYSEPFTMSRTRGVANIYTYSESDNLSALPSSMFMDPGYYLIGCLQGIKNTFYSDERAIDFNVARAMTTFPTACLPISAIGVDTSSWLTTRFTDTDYKKQPFPRAVSDPTAVSTGIKISEATVSTPYYYEGDDNRVWTPPRYLSTSFRLTVVDPPVIITITSPTVGQPGDLLTKTMGFTDGQSVTAKWGDQVSGGISLTSARAATRHNTLGPQTVFIRSTCFGESKSIGPSHVAGEMIDTSIMGIVSLANVPWGTYSHHNPEDATINLHRYRHSRTLSHMDFQITDVAGRVLTLPANRHATMAVKLFMTKTF